MAARQLTSSAHALSGVPVLMYHDVCAMKTRTRYAVTLSDFSAQLETLQTLRITPTDLDDIPTAASRRRVVLTFDDGLASNYEPVFPELLKHGHRATFFISTALVGTAGYVTWNQLREMSDAGMNLGSHGHLHTDYSRLKSSVALDQLRASRQALEDITGKAVSSFSAPYGFLNKRLLECARSVGFQQICSSLPWLATSGLAIIPRIAIYSDTRLSEFLAIAQGRLSPLLSRLARHCMLYAPKHFLLRTWPQRLGVNVQEVAR